MSPRTVKAGDEVQIVASDTKGYVLVVSGQYARVQRERWSGAALGYETVTEAYRLTELKPLRHGIFKATGWHPLAATPSTVGSGPSDAEAQDPHGASGPTP